MGQGQFHLCQQAFDRAYAVALTVGYINDALMHTDTMGSIQFAGGWITIGAITALAIA